jgi:hypothetical protein
MEDKHRPVWAAATPPEPAQAEHQPEVPEMVTTRAAERAAQAEAQQEERAEQERAEQERAEQERAEQELC